MAAPTGYLTLDGLRSAIADGHVDTLHPYEAYNATMGGGKNLLGL